MDAPGVTVRPIVDMTGDHAFNEVFLDEVRLPAEHLVGRGRTGVVLAKVTLGTSGSRCRGKGRCGVRARPPGTWSTLCGGPAVCATRLLRQRLARVWVEGEVLRLIRLRTVSAVVAGRAPGPEASVRKALADDHGQHVMELAKDLAGAYGLADAGPRGLTAGPGDGTVRRTVGLARGRRPVLAGVIWSKGYLFSRALTIGGGTAEVQRNIIAERVLGLPHDVDASDPVVAETGAVQPDRRRRPRRRRRPLDHPPDEGGEGVGMARVGAVARARELDDLGRRGPVRPG